MPGLSACPHRQARSRLPGDPPVRMRRRRDMTHRFYRMDGFPAVKDSRTTLYPASGSSRKFFNTWACGKRLMPRRIATPREERSPWIFPTASQCKKPSPPLGGGLTSDCLEDFWVLGGYTSKRNSYHFIILTLLELPDYKPRRLNC